MNTFIFVETSWNKSWYISYLELRNLRECNHMVRAMRKPVFWSIRRAKVQISLSIRAVWSGSSMSACTIMEHNKMYQWKANAGMRLCACVGWIWICAVCACSKIDFRLTRSIKYGRCGRLWSLLNIFIQIYAVKGFARSKTNKKKLIKIKRKIWKIPIMI